MTDVQFGIRYADFWNGDGGGVVKGLFSVPEDAIADNILSLDELASWDTRLDGE